MNKNNNNSSFNVLRKPGKCTRELSEVIQKINNFYVHLFKFKQFLWYKLYTIIIYIMWYRIRSDTLMDMVNAEGRSHGLLRYAPGIHLKKYIEASEIVRQCSW